MQRAPSITLYSYDSNSALTVTWEIDSFFPSSEAPDDVSIEINNLTYKKNLGSNARSIVIPAVDLARLPGVEIGFTVVFEWIGTPSNAQRASVNIPLLGRGGQPANVRLNAPIVTVVAIGPQTLSHPNQITISWVSNNYTSGQIIWGKVGESKHLLDFEPGKKGREPDYTGKFTTDIPLLPRTMYEFTVQVRNSFEGTGFLPTTIAVRSSPNFISLKAFLKASAVPSFGNLKVLLKHGGSLRNTMGI
jgi:hypothetical protein